MVGGLIVVVLVVGVFLATGGEVPGINTGGPSGTSLTCWSGTGEVDPNTGKEYVEPVECPVPGQLSIFGGVEDISFFTIQTSVTPTDVTFDLFRMTETTPAIILDTYKNGDPTVRVKVGPIVVGNTVSWNSLEQSIPAEDGVACDVNSLVCDNGESEEPLGVGLGCVCLIPTAQFEPLPQPVSFTSTIDGTYTFGGNQIVTTITNGLTVAIDKNPDGTFDVDVQASTA